MTYEFRLPDIGEGVAEGEVVQWFVKEGDAIQEDQPLVSVLTDKANVEIPSPKTGRIAKIHAPVGQKVKVGGVLVSIETGETPSGRPSTSSGPVAAPGGGDHRTPPVAASAVGVAPGSGAQIQASPHVRRLAAERGIDLATLRGSGPSGRIVEADLAVSPTPTARVPAAVTASMSTVAASGAGTTSAGTVPPNEIRERIPIRGVRRVIAEHMSESVHRAAHFTYVEEIDASELVRLRERMAKSIEKHGMRLSYLPFIVKAVVASLKSFPRFNATVDDAHEELVVRAGYHIGIATAAPDGLLVPVVRDADKKSLAQLTREIQDLAERGRAGKLARNELTGSTFTISSLGALGGVLATPILNYPEVAILGVHKIQARPVIRADGTIAPAELMNLSLSLDHRVLDGYEGAQFLAAVKGYLEDPHQLFVELA